MVGGAITEKCCPVSSLRRTIHACHGAAGAVGGPACSSTSNPPLLISSLSSTSAASFFTRKKSSRYMVVFCTPLEAKRTIPAVICPKSKVVVVISPSTFFHVLSSVTNVPCTYVIAPAPTLYSKWVFNCTSLF